MRGSCLENFLLCARVVFPLFVLLAVGVLLRAVGVLDAQAVKKVNKLVFYVAVPALCFLNIYRCDFSLIDSLRYPLCYIGTLLACWLIIVLLVSRLVGDNGRKGSLIQGMARSNDGVYGLAVAASLLDSEHMLLMLVLLAVAIPLNNMLSILSFEMFRGGRLRAGKMLLSLVKNPILIGLVLGFLCNVCGVTLPEVLVSPIQSLSNMCAPLAFISLGAMLSFSSLKKNWRLLTVAAAVKLVVLPAVGVAVAMLLGYRNEALLALLLMYASPTAVTSMTLAAELGGNEQLSAEIVAVSTAFSVLTIFLFLFTMKQTGVI